MGPKIQFIYDTHTLTYTKVPPDLLQSFLDAVGLDQPFSYKPIINAEVLAGIGGKSEYRMAAYHLKHHRIRKKLSQKELADTLGIGQANLSNIENARKGVGKKLAQKLGAEFSEDPRTFLTGIL